MDLAELQNFTAPPIQEYSILQQLEKYYTVRGEHMNTPHSEPFILWKTHCLGSAPPPLSKPTPEAIGPMLKPSNSRSRNPLSQTKISNQNPKLVKPADYELTPLTSTATGRQSSNPTILTLKCFQGMSNSALIVVDKACICFISETHKHH